MDNKIRLFVAGSCGPCAEVKKLVGEGRVNQAGVEMIDLEEGNNYEKWKNQVPMTKVPSAFRGTKQCQLNINDETRQLVLTCPES